MHIYLLNGNLQEITENAYLKIKNEQVKDMAPETAVRGVGTGNVAADEVSESEEIADNSEIRELSDYTGITRKKKAAAVIVTNTRGTLRAFQLADMTSEMENVQGTIHFCKVEAQQECLIGTLKIPRLSDVRNNPFRIRFLVNRRHIVIIDDTEMTQKVIRKICRFSAKPGNSRERFLYNYISQFITKDSEFLGTYEKRIAEIEDKIADGDIDEVEDVIRSIRRELLTMRSYYMELRDVGKQLEENENNVFSKKNLSYFGILSDRADRLLGKTIYLLDYVGQVRDSYQIEVAKAQNKNMEFLTIVSTIFYPLTLITGWYGMNFKNMPELENGYPFIILLSILVIIIIILIFKKRKIF